MPKTSSKPACVGKVRSGDGVEDCKGEVTTTVTDAASLGIIRDQWQPDIKRRAQLCEGHAIAVEMMKGGTPGD